MPGPILFEIQFSFSIFPRAYRHVLRTVYSRWPCPTGFPFSWQAPLPDDATLTRFAVVGVAALCGCFTGYATRHGWLENVSQNWVPTIEWFDDEKRWKKVSNCEAKGPFWSFWNISTLLDSWCCTATFSQSQLQKVDTSNRPQFYSTKVSTTEQSRPWNWGIMRQIAFADVPCTMSGSQNRTMTVNWWFQHVQPFLDCYP